MPAAHFWPPGCAVWWCRGSGGPGTESLCHVKQRPGLTAVSRETTPLATRCHPVPRDAIGTPASGPRARPFAPPPPPEPRLDHRQHHARPLSLACTPQSPTPAVQRGIAPPPPTVRGPATQFHVKDRTPAGLTLLARDAGPDHPRACPKQPPPGAPARSRQPLRSAGPPAAVSSRPPPGFPPPNQARRPRRRASPPAPAPADRRQPYPAAPRAP